MMIVRSEVIIKQWCLLVLIHIQRQEKFALTTTLSSSQPCDKVRLISASEINVSNSMLSRHGKHHPTRITVVKLY